jgi:hypothetical protein
MPEIPESVKLRIKGSKLDAEQINRVLAFIGKYGETTPCEICRSNSWSVVDCLLEVREYGVLSGNVLTLGGSLIPLVGIGCSTCGHLRLISAIACGIIDREGKVVNG